MFALRGCALVGRQQQQENMPHGKKWTSEECRALAISYCNASECVGEEKPSGSDQKKDEFLVKLMSNFQRLAPACQNDAGRYHLRGTNAVWNYFRDHLKHDVNKFNIALRLVQASKPTGVDKNQVVNMAVAIHTGRTKKMEYKYKDFSAHNWMHYEAWKVLVKHPKFALASGGNAKERVTQTAASLAGPHQMAMIDDDNEDEASNAVTPDTCKASANDRNDLVDATVADVKAASRGKPKTGKGASKRKASAEKATELKKVRILMETRQVQSSQQTRMIGLKTIIEATANGVDPVAHQEATNKLFRLMTEIEAADEDAKKQRAARDRSEE